VIPTALAIARVAGKYQMDNLHQDGLRILRKHYPNTFKDWNRLGNDSVYDYSFPYGLEVAFYAFEHNVVELLPASCYSAICHHEFVELLNLDIPKAFGNLLLKLYHQIDAGLGIWTLSWLDEAPDEKDWKCPHGSYCEPALRFLRNFRTTYRPRLFLDPFDTYMGAMEEFYSEAHDTPLPFCKRCRKYAREVHEDGRNDAWDRLSVYLGLKE
jgi:hypothetical protein